MSVWILLHIVYIICDIVSYTVVVSNTITSESEGQNHNLFHAGVRHGSAELPDESLTSTNHVRLNPQPLTVQQSAPVEAGFCPSRLLETGEVPALEDVWPETRGSSLTHLCFLQSIVHFSPVSVCLRAFYFEINNV